MQTTKVVELRSEPLLLAVAPSACGAITRFCFAEGGRTVDLLRPASPPALAARDPLGMSCFPLVPFSNRIRNGRFTFQGREVTLPPNFPPEPHAIHGHGWKAPWTLTDLSGASATIEYRHEADAWPFPYLARQQFVLADGRLDLRVAVVNEGEAPMPLGFGVHPYFPRTPRARVRAEVDRMWTTDHDAMPSRLVPLPADLPLSFAGVNPDQVALDANFLGFGGWAEVEWPEHGATLRLEARGPFPCLVVYTPPGQPFFCVEPVTNCIDAFNLAALGRQDTGMLVLPPRAELDGTISFIPTVAGRGPEA